ncbi:TonB-dependent receptor domain-containing protein [Neolewinella antarctica]|uniref:Fe(3+) dicitrate transport protein n=1 Tax=Neolewinella antarctica TaxID=442734 RepID=A0ABX0X7C2_9BACT|nr:TonB-dependent receptor [Neolewinella antarctica]NJC25042.1 Fe(3+) dicitrate transport protein [Neolewinella antarctica]
MLASLTLLIVTLPSIGVRAQTTKLVVTVVDSASRQPLRGVDLYLSETQELRVTNAQGKANFSIQENIRGVTLLSYQSEFSSLQYHFPLTGPETSITIELRRLNMQLDAVTVIGNRDLKAAIRRLRAVEGTAIYAGKKTEVVNVAALTANLAANQARQLYARVSGLNIYESDDAGLQLSIGGRGLDPNRSASFNTRQNGYDISADVLGYPESYYTPPAEALAEIQVVRGAASLQYGTQFGGLVNFVFHEPNRNRKIELISRQTVGSYGLFTSFNSLSGTVGKVGYYGYVNYKRGDGFRPNSDFDSRNAYLHLDYSFSENARLTFEYTYLDYLAQQAGGLTDAQFYKDPFQSNRTRNHFKVDWQLYNLRYEHKLTDRTNLSLSVFGLDASRAAVGFRTNRVSQVDDLDAPRDLIVNDFNNYGAEGRLLHRYTIGKRSAIALIGAKYYHADNTAFQGPGTNGKDADFNLATDRFPSFPSQSQFTFPNRNLAIFGEHIFYLNDRLSVTPGARYEYIKTESSGTFRRIDFDLANNPIRDTEFDDNRTFARNLLLLGVGLSYRDEGGTELFANFSQNYRSVTFNDIRTVNPSFQVDPDISDEDGYTADVGFRAAFKQIDVTANIFGLRYNDRLGEVLTPEVIIRADGTEVRSGRIVRRRGNIGTAFIYGLESLVTWKAVRGKTNGGVAYSVEAFANTSLTRSQYTSSETAGVEGNEVEFIPFLNLKTGISAGYGDLLASLQYVHLSSQFTDASNAGQDVRDNQSGIVGEIPAYGVMDLSLSYRWKKLLVETGAGNLLDQQYFTRRATGYPGPGIIPSAPRSFYLTLGVRL